MGWPVCSKCPVACLPFEESQQPTWPQTRHIRNSTHDCPAARHPSQPLVFGVTQYWVNGASRTGLYFVSLPERWSPKMLTNISPRKLLLTLMTLALVAPAFAVIRRMRLTSAAIIDAEKHGGNGRDVPPVRPRDARRATRQVRAVHRLRSVPRVHVHQA